MVGVATSSIEAATTEDFIGSTGNLQHQVDPDVQVGIDYKIYVHIVFKYGNNFTWHSNVQNRELYALVFFPKMGQKFQNIRLYVT